MSKHEQSLKDALGANDPAGALAHAEHAVRADPSSAHDRIALFQLMCVLGQWERALDQLEVIGGLDALALPMVTTYREAIKCETVRAKVFAGGTTPLALGEPQPWLAWLVEALQRDGAGDAVAAGALREKAFEQAQFVLGEADVAAFEWIADNDIRLGPILEAIVGGRYYWMPMAALARIDLEAPQDLRDFVWAPAHFQFVNGGETVGLIPTRYPGSERCPDGAIQLARRTEWQPVAGGGSVGLGQRVFATEATDLSLLELRRITLQQTPADGAAGPRP